MGKGLVEEQLESKVCWQLSGVFTGATETKDPAKSPGKKVPLKHLPVSETMEHPPPAAAQNTF